MHGAGFQPHYLPLDARRCCGGCARCLALCCCLPLTELVYAGPCVCYCLPCKTLACLSDLGPRMVWNAVVCPLLSVPFSGMGAIRLGACVTNLVFRLLNCLICIIAKERIDDLRQVLHCAMNLV